MSYQGWSNWKTWNVVLWCDNEEAIYRDRQRSEPKTAEEVEEFVREWFPNGTPDMSRDPYKDSGEGEVDWDEIASHWAAEYESEDESEAS